MGTSKEKSFRLLKPLRSRQKGSTGNTPAKSPHAAPPAGPQAPPLRPRPSGPAPRRVVATGAARGRARGGGGKMAAPVSLCHIACCANRAGGGAVAWGRSGLLAFGSCHDVILYDPAVS